MYNSDTDILFPSRVIPTLKDLRGEIWRELVAGVIQAEPDGLERFAFVLLMARLCACSTCNANSFRAMHGCTRCAGQAVLHFRGSDADLLNSFGDARLEVDRQLQKDDKTEGWYV